MTEEIVVELLKEVFYTTFIILLPILGVSLVVGIFISVFQAATSIQEQTLTFVPKILVTAVTLVFMMPWIIEKIMSFTIKMLTMFTTVLK